MKIFDQEAPFADKVNFVDEDNVVLGYNMAQDCCEHAGWFIAEKPILDFSSDADEGPEFDVTAYRFDTEYDVTIDPPASLDEGDVEVFRLVADGKPDLFLHIFNAHNGYYSHGFAMKRGEEMIAEGYL